MSNNKDKWDKHFETVKSTSIQPGKEDTPTDTYECITKQQLKVLKKLDPAMYAQYGKGKLISTNINLNEERYEEILRTTIKCVFQCIWEHINDEIEELEDRQQELIKVSAVEDVMLSSLEVLKTLKIKLDINSVFSIIYGYIGQSVCTIAKDYEYTRSIKH